MPFAQDQDGATLGMSRRTALAAVPILAIGGAAGVRVLAQTGRPVLHPEDFRTDADQTDDAASIQAAIERAAELGGAVVRFAPGKTYRLETIAEGSEVSSKTYRASLALPPRASNVTLDLNGATLLQVADAFTFGTRFRMFNDKVLETTRSAARDIPAIGATFVDLVNSKGLVPGSRVMLVSGNISRRAYVPVAEMFVVTAVEAGRVHLDRPIRKDHTLAAGDRTGVIDITDHHASNFALLGGGRVVNEHRRAGHLVQFDGCVLRNIEVAGCGGFSLRGRNLLVEDHTISIAGKPGRGRRPYALAFDTGSSEIVVRNFTARGEDFCYLHLHEGLRDVHISNFEIRNGTRYEPAWSGPAAISVLGLSWQVHMSNIRIHGNPQGAGIAARASGALPLGNHDLVMQDIVLSGEFRQPALLIDDRNVVRIEGLNLRGARVRNGRRAVSLSGAQHRLLGVMAP